MSKLIGSLSFLILLFSVFSKFAFSQDATNASADDGSVCNASSTLNSSVGGSCRTTPTTYEISIYEMGLCSSHPYGTSKVSTSFDSSTCVTTYTDTSPTAVDIAGNIGGTTKLSGTSSPPTEGTYKYPYMIMGNSFDVAGNVTNADGDVWYSTSSGTATTTAASAGTYTSTLTNFGDTTCYSGYVGASVSGGTIDGFIANSRSARSISSEVSSSICNKNGRVVGVMTLSSPIIVTSQTIGVIFHFMLTNYGVQFVDLSVGDGGDGDADDPEGFDSAPFSGYFTVLNAD